MKYNKPELHFISANKADAFCVDGSNASSIQECTLGPGVTGGRCNSGGVPSQKCTTGTAPSNCSPTGVNVGVGCLTGTVVN